MPLAKPSSKIARFICIIGFSVFLVIAVVGMLFWQMNKTIFDEGFASGKNAEWPHLHIPPSDKQPEYDVKFAAVLERYPDLKPQWKNVPNEENGFVQLLNLSEYVLGANGAEAEYKMTLSEELRRELSDFVSEEKFAGG
ncbi:MAG: hypothetical protein QNL01_06340 [Akkermansiaceae bacterium]|jgi:hypothetical protein|tara:strand:- start:6799 stop:7215 length:417 start_codon:yes stop_codon:yes gene_type:complete